MLISLLLYFFKVIFGLLVIQIISYTVELFAGGIFALYSLLCRHAKFCLLPNQQAADEELSTYHGEGRSNRSAPPSAFKKFVERRKKVKTALLLVVLFCASMVITMGVLTPAISSKLLIVTCISSTFDLPTPHLFLLLC